MITMLYCNCLTLHMTERANIPRAYIKINYCYYFFLYSIVVRKLISAETKTQLLSGLQTNNFSCCQDSKIDMDIHLDDDNFLFALYIKKIQPNKTPEKNLYCGYP